MSALNGLKLVAASPTHKANPVVQRRQKVLSQLSEQIALAGASVRGESYVSSRTVVVRDEATGTSQTKTRAKRVKQWWFVSETGRVCLQVRYGNRVLELAKGKNSVEVGAAKDLVSVLEVVKSAVTAGELDTQIEAASAAVRERFAK
jgi:hypothetical protein